MFPIDQSSYYFFQCETTRVAICGIKNWFGILVQLLRKFEVNGSEIVFVKTAIILIILYSVPEAAPGIDGSKLALKKLRDVHADFMRRGQRRQEEEKQK